MREIRRSGLTRGKPHQHAPQRLRPKVEIARASRMAYRSFGGDPRPYGEPRRGAQAALNFLGGKGFSHDSTSGFRYVIGDTFPDIKKGANHVIPLRNVNP